MVAPVALSVFSSDTWPRAFAETLQMMDALTFGTYSKIYAVTKEDYPEAAHGFCAFKTSQNLYLLYPENVIHMISIWRERTPSQHFPTVLERNILTSVVRAVRGKAYYVLNGAIRLRTYATVMADDDVEEELKEFLQESKIIRNLHTRIAQQRMRNVPVPVEEYFALDLHLTHCLANYGIRRGQKKEDLVRLITY
jgi:hypothetical protein